MDYPICYFMGKFAVSIFFIISGYLLGSVVLQGRGWAGFYIKRFFRIAPMTYVSSLLCIAIASAIGFSRHNTPDFLHVFFWFDGGLTTIRPPVYGVEDAHLINAGVTWSLMWEWIFYFLLPLLSLPFFLTRRLQVLVLTIVVLCAIYIVSIVLGFENGPHFYNRYSVFGPVYVTLFALGAVIRVSRGKWPNLRPVSKNFLDIGSLVLLTAFFVVGPHHDPISLPFAFAYGLFFLLFVCGADWFGFLRRRGVILLGDASYSIYLLHGIGWFLADMVCFHYGIDKNVYLYYAIMTASWYVICYVSVKTYETIEMRFIRLGSHVVRRLHLNG